LLHFLPLLFVPDDFLLRLRPPLRAPDALAAWSFLIADETLEFKLPINALASFKLPSACISFSSGKKIKTVFLVGDEKLNHHKK
jgi:hypothetical protein